MGYHGKSDWGLQLKKTVYTLDDLSELAVRLGSEVFFDRRGDVYLIDSFKNGIGSWSYVKSGSGADIILTALVSKSGGYSVKLIGGSTSGYYAKLFTVFPYPVLSKWGFEVHFCLLFGIDKLDFNLYAYTGSQLLEAIIRYDFANDKLQYLKDEGNYQDIETSFKLSRIWPLFHVLKMVIDFENGKYHRLIIDGTTYDLSAYDVPPTSSEVVKRMGASVTLRSVSGDNDYCYIDNIIITQNEP